MKRQIAMTLGLLLIAAVAHSADPVPTGDRKLDSILRGINTEARTDQGGGLTELLRTKYKIPEQDIVQARDTHGLDPASLYMSAAIAHATQKPMLTVVEEYKKNEGRGWGVMAQEMGIKPGSAAFHELKRGGQGARDHMRANSKAKQKQEKQMRKEQERKAKNEAKGKGGGRPN